MSLGMSLSKLIKQLIHGCGLIRREMHYYSTAVHRMLAELGFCQITKYFITILTIDAMRVMSGSLSALSSWWIPGDSSSLIRSWRLFGFTSQSSIMLRQSKTNRVRTREVTESQKNMEPVLVCIACLVVLLPATRDLEFSGAFTICGASTAPLTNRQP